ncbi:MAG: hypothetical protein H6713_35290 [Myxococcales bacterium]|nr:hypothetical protein [Myxococcales bacterium]
MSPAPEEPGSRRVVARLRCSSLSLTGAGEAASSRSAAFACSTRAAFDSALRSPARAGALGCWFKGEDAAAALSMAAASACFLKMALAAADTRGMSRPIFVDALARGCEPSVASRAASAPE